jgi:chaperone required for assembly of F1-ATPase
MSSWAARRFWTAASVEPADGGYIVKLDARPLRTPLKAPLVLPTEALAAAIAAEWQAQEGKVHPQTMPFTLTANSAIDKVAPQFAEVATMLADYGGSDLLCYRAEDPPELVDRQSRGWDPLLGWAATSLAAPLVATPGVMHIDQPAASLTRLRQLVEAMSPFHLAGFHDLVSISGSLILALAVVHHRLTPEAAWDLSRIDEDWQISLWGEDEEAADLASLKRAAFLQADRFYGLCG